VTAFTALMFIVNANLLIRSRYLTWIHLFHVTVGALIIYFVYIWIGNYLEISQTRFAVLEAHKSPTFYLTIGCCLAFTVSVDFALEAYRVLIR